MLKKLYIISIYIYYQNCLPSQASYQNNPKVWKPRPNNFGMFRTCRVSGFLDFCKLYGFIPDPSPMWSRCCNGSFESTRMFRWPHRGQVVACFEGRRWAYGRSSWIWIFHIKCQIFLFKLSHAWHIHDSWLFATATWHTDLHEAFGLARPRRCVIVDSGEYMQYVTVCLTFLKWIRGCWRLVFVVIGRFPVDLSWVDVRIVYHEGLGL